MRSRQHHCVVSARDAGSTTVANTLRPNIKTAPVGAYPPFFPLFSLCRLKPRYVSGIVPNRYPARSQCARSARSAIDGT